MSTRVVGVLAGNDTPLNLIKIWADSAEYLIAADGAANQLLTLGFCPDVIGDMDSFDRSASGADQLKILEKSEQATTDCDKLLAHCVFEGHDEVTLIGLEGDRMDHLLASVYSALRAPLRVRFALRSGMAWVLGAGDERRLKSAPGRSLSLLPLGEAGGVVLGGAEWDLDEASLSPNGLVSISNRTISDEVFAKVTTGAALLIIETPLEEMPLW